MNILDTIGETSLVRLRKVVPPDCADIHVKLEWENPTDSMKDRMALAAKIVAVEPAESAVLSGGQPGPHKIEGVNIGYVPPLWDATLRDEILPVITPEAKAMTRWLALEEGLFAGTSSGANVVAAIQLARRLGSGARVVTLMVDSGLK